jgi:choline-sulfatase
MMRWVLIASAVIALVVVGIISFPRTRPIGSYPRHNILVISVDTLRPDRLGVYGYERPTSPVVDELASEAITFERAFAPRGMTWPSLATMLTGLQPTTTNVRWNGQYIPLTVANIARLLRNTGYETGAFLGGSICHMAGATHSFDTLACGEDTELSAKAGEFFRAPKRRPFFTWVHYMATHAPYQPAAEYDRFTRRDYAGPVRGDRATLDGLVVRQEQLSADDLAQLNGLYDGEVLSADAQVAQLLAALDDGDLRRNTIILFTADHGEDLWEHNRYLYHACSIYDSSLQVPLILALPDGGGAGTRFRDVVELVDVTPTLLELVGVARLPSFEGTSLLPRLGVGDGAHADDSANEPTATGEWYDPALRKSLQTVRTARWRYISNPDELTPRCVPEGDYYKVAREELYDHDADPGETRNVAAEHPEVTQRFAALLGGSDAAKDAAPLPIDPKLRDQLRALGYLE